MDWEWRKVSNYIDYTIFEEVLISSVHPGNPTLLQKSKNYLKCSIICGPFPGAKPGRKIRPVHCHPLPMAF